RRDDAASSSSSVGIRGAGAEGAPALAQAQAAEDAAEAAQPLRPPQQPHQQPQPQQQQPQQQEAEEPASGPQAMAVPRREASRGEAGPRGSSSLDGAGPPGGREKGALPESPSAVGLSDASTVDLTLESIDQNEASINSQLLAIWEESRSIKVGIDAATSEEEKEGRLRALLLQKRDAKRLMEQKQALIDRRMQLTRLEHLERELERESRDLEELDSVIKLNVDEEVQRQLAQCRDGFGVGSEAPRGFEEPEPHPEWHAREQQLNRLRAQLSERKGALEHERRLRE
ncbi:unnamed protein product, partial [Prorocentrum cordatum]